jgi:arylsulfatase A-like enzyme/tetratricopeptide (TPR) repeat protein
MSSRQWLALSLQAVAMLSAGCGRAPVTPPRSKPNVLLITIDTFRADRLNASVTPALDRLAASGLRFTAARTAVPLTLPSHATILTGLLPPTHGVRENGIDQLSDVHPTIAPLLKGAGYRTGAAVGAFVLDRRFGLAAGFDAYDDRIPRDPAATERLEAERPASAVVDAAIAWLNANVAASPPAPPAPPALPALPAPPAPFFLWVHLYDPHAPYAPPPEFRGRSKTPYDDELSYTDSQVARLLDWLKTHGAADRTLIAIAGDHGEGLGDHGERTHGMLLYDSTLRVPLVLVAPGYGSAVIDEPVSLADVAPTILRAVGVASPAEMKGRDLLAGGRLKPDTTDAARSGGVRLQPDLYSETMYPRVAGWSPLQALTDGRWMTIRSGSSTELYDLKNDPGELRDVNVTQAATASAMSARMDAIQTVTASSSSRTVPPDVAERLRALGYVASSTQPAVAANAPNPAATIDSWNRFEDALTALNAHKPEALPLLETLARAHSDSPLFQTTFARALKDEGRLTQALAAYRGAARRWPADATLLHDLAVAAREAAQSAKGAPARALREEAARAEQASVALAPTGATAHNGLGLIAIDDGRTQDAAAEFERASALDPNNASYLANLGNARRAAGDRAGAEQAYRRALDIDARTPDAANGLGVLLVEAHRASDAIAYFERALESAPDFVEARLNLGIALQEAGQTKRAADEYRRVLAARGAAREKDAAAKLLAGLGVGR